MTLAEVFDALLGPAGSRRGNKSRVTDNMTPTRYIQAGDLIAEGAPAAVVAEAVNRITASRWLDKPAREVTPADIDALWEARPWEKERAR